MLYARTATIATIYPQTSSALLVPVGWRRISTYLARFLPDAAIDSVELDRAVIDVAKNIFGARETADPTFIESDGRRVPEPPQRALRPHSFVDAFTAAHFPFP